jgi:hypothetical protein
MKESLANERRILRQCSLAMDCGLLAICIFPVWIYDAAQRSRLLAPKQFIISQGTYLCIDECSDRLGCSEDFICIIPCLDAKSGARSLG